MNGKSETISFRLSTEHYRRVTELAAASGTTPGDEARRRLIDSLSGEANQQELREHFQSLEQELTCIKHDLPKIAEALMLAITQTQAQGKTITPEKVKQWVTETLKCTR